MTSIGFQPIEATAAHSHAEPSAHAASFVIVASRPAPGLQKNFVKHLFCIAGAQQASAEEEQSRRMVSEEFVEGVAISSTHASDQGLIALVTRRSFASSIFCHRAADVSIGERLSH